MFNDISEMSDYQKLKFLLNTIKEIINNSKEEDLVLKLVLYFQDYKDGYVTINEKEYFLNFTTEKFKLEDVYKYILLRATVLDIVSNYLMIVNKNKPDVTIVDISKLFNDMFKIYPKAISELIIAIRDKNQDYIDKVKEEISYLEVE